MAREGMARAAALVMAVTLAACGGGAGPGAPTAMPEVPAARPAAAPTARYQVTFEATWSASTHPDDFPSDPHFSRLVGGTHRGTVSFWQPGGMASEGIRLMAERGRTTPLDQEVAAAVAAGHARGVLLGGDVPLSPGSTSLELEVTTEHPLVTLVTMVAPSPDWFLGVSGLSLLEGGDWVSQRSVELFAHDAGTDSGGTYRAADRATAPAQPIQQLIGHPVGVSPAPMGRLVFRRLS